MNPFRGSVARSRTRTRSPTSSPASPSTIRPSAGGVSKLLNLRGDGSHFGVERALQRPYLVLQLRYITLQLHDFFAGCRTNDRESEGCG